MSFTVRGWQVEECELNRVADFTASRTVDDLQRSHLINGIEPHNYPLSDQHDLSIHVMTLAAR